jgi:hypothetical protein
MLDAVQVGTHRSGAKYPRDALFKGRNIQELSVRDTSVGNTSTLHQDPNVDPNTVLDFVKPYHAPAVSHLGVENPGKTSEAFCSGTRRLGTK